MSKKKTNKKKKPIFKRISTWFVKYIRDTWKVKILSLLFGGLIVYHTKTMPNLNILEEFVCFSLIVGAIFIFVFIKNDIYKAFIGDIKEP